MQPECCGTGTDPVDCGLVDVVAAGLRVSDSSEPLGGGGADLLVVDGLLEIGVPVEDLEAIEDPLNGSTDGCGDDVDAAGSRFDQVVQLGRLFHRGEVGSC